MSVYRDLFVESPYAAALEEKYLETRCSTCFKKDAKVVCNRKCKMIRYCDDKCREDDRPIHKFECHALASEHSMEILRSSSTVRLLARVLTRRLMDRGVARLSVGFPKNIENRRLDDLIDHQEDFESDKRRFDQMTAVLADFESAFRHTQWMNDFDLAKLVYCVVSINAFSISDEFDMERGNQGVIGSGLFLNASRFDHSCRPDLEWHFDGAKIVIQYPSTAEASWEVAEERMEMTSTKEKFNSFTICYGFDGGRFPLPLRQQRRESLERRYFFECQCSLCSDEGELELHAAAFWCEKCHEPYVWRDVPSPRVSCLTREPVFTIKCQPSCECKFDKEETKKIWRKAEEYKRDAKAEKNLKKLESEWYKIMKTRGKPSRQDADEVIKQCEPVWKMASLLWHCRVNLRMHHLQDWLFKAYYVERASASLDLLKRAISLGENTIDWYNRHFADKSCFSYEKALYAVRMANLHKTKLVHVYWARSAFEKDRSTAAGWYRYTAFLWQAYGRYTPPSVYERLEEEAQRVKTMSMVRMEDERDR